LKPKRAGEKEKKKKAVFARQNGKWVSASRSAASELKKEGKYNSKGRKKKGGGERP